ncbi:hypothetical protein Z945_1707 [Sulfitobacter noctilucae]|uniref:hypothetical protein n=1 Tax=Sulfitobacter noctilucae TaxID=1342302 RepID=UPI000468D993|nr:hypothetical protein [Sulfitobacter noctilucae]KIN60728.1 hypothetical protein Z945_1707 [Sulfitobacter noctilucae]
MEYGKKKPIQGKNGYEKTALTMKTISELLADEGTSMEELTKSQTPAEQNADTWETPCATVVPKRPVLQQPPHMQATSAPQHAVPSKAATLPPIAPTGAEAGKATYIEKPRSLLSRLIGK